MRLRAAIGLALTFACARAWGGGTELVEQSPAALGVAGAMTGRADDAEAVFYNPAGLTRQRGLGLKLGGGLWALDGKVTAPGLGGSLGTRGLWGAPYVYLTDRLGPHVGIGVGVFQQFGGNVRFPTGWPGGLGGTNFDLTTTTINPEVAFRPFPEVAVGFGLMVVPTSLALGRDTDLAPTSRAGMQAWGRGVGVGANVGVLVQAVPRYLRIGLSYRSLVDIQLDGEGDFLAPGVVARPPQYARIPYTLPHNLALGLSSQPTQNLTLSADVRWTLFGATPRFLTVTLAPKGTDPNANGVDSSVELNPRDAVAVRLGLEYRLLGGLLPLRFGFGVDTTPVRRGWLVGWQPDSLRIVASLGGGYTIGPATIELGYSVQGLVDRTSTSAFSPGLGFGGIVHVAALGLAVRLPDLGVRVDVPEFKH